MASIVVSPRMVGVRELRQNASEVLRRVQTFGPFLVTVAGRPAATLSPWENPEKISVAQFDGLVEATPETDTRRYELIEGTLVVSPSPDFEHQRISRDLLVALQTAAAPAYEAVATWSWLIDQHNCPQPDLLVVATDVAHGPRLQGTPALVVEVTSSNRAEDLTRKCELYARGGAPVYWVVDRRACALLEYRMGDGATSYGDPVTHDAMQGTVQLHTSFGAVAVDLGSVFGR